MFCRASLNGGLSDVFLMTRRGGGVCQGWGGVFREGDHRREVPFLAHGHRASQVLVTLITWSRWCLPGVFT